MHFTFKYVFILSMKFAYLIQLCRAAGHFLIFFCSTTLYSNTLLDCCGLLVGQVVDYTPPASVPIVRQVKPVRHNPVVEKPPRIEAVIRPTKKELAIEKIVKARTERQKQILKPVRQPVIQAVNKNKAIIDCLKKKLGRSINNPPVSSTAPAMFYYAPRMKSIRVTSPPNIDGWERSLREEMRLKGRSRHTVGRLLARIQNYYEDPTIEASDYAPGNEGYKPSSGTLKLAESRIRRSVESMTEFYKKSKNIEMDNSKLTNGGEMMKGKLAFINTQLDKIGKERVSMEDLREIVGLKLSPPSVKPEIAKALPKVDRLGPVVPIPEIAQLVPLPKEVEGINGMKKVNIEGNDLVEAKIEQLYQKFATWLADNGKTFPSLDPEVDTLTLSYFEQVNEELRKLGNFEKMNIFREKTLAYLDEILDDRGQDFIPVDQKPKLIKPIISEEDDPLFRGKNSSSYIHLASLPGRVIPVEDQDSPLNPQLLNALTHSERTEFDKLGNKRVFRVMDNLPGKVVY